MSLFKRKPISYRSVLFVCTANVTRSVTAEALFRHKADADKDNLAHGERWDVASAGVKASHGVGQNSPLNVRLHSKGIPIPNHRSQPISPKLFKRSYWIIVMERAHKEAIIEKFPDVADRVFVLREFGLDEPPSESDMPDPTGKEKENYTEFFDILEKEIPRIYEELKERVNDLELWGKDKPG